MRCSACGLLCKRLEQCRVDGAVQRLCGECLIRVIDADASRPNTRAAPPVLATRPPEARATDWTGKGREVRPFSTLRIDHRRPRKGEP